MAYLEANTFEFYLWLAISLVYGISLTIMYIVFRKKEKMEKGN
jgi:hypothetical protein